MLFAAAHRLEQGSFTVIELSVQGPYYQYICPIVRAQPILQVAHQDPLSSLYLPATSPFPPLLPTVLSSPETYPQSMDVVFQGSNVSRLVDELLRTCFESPLSVF